MQPQKGKTMAKINKPSIATDTSLLVVGHNRGVGFSEKVTYNSETREQVIKLVLKGEKSAIDTGTCQARVVQCHHATRPSRQTDLPFRPWRAVQQHELPNDALGEWDNALNECCGVSLRQRLYGKLLRKLQEGDGLQAGLQGHRRRAGGRFQVHRAVLQPETAP